MVKYKFFINPHTFTINSEEDYCKEKRSDWNLWKDELNGREYGHKGMVIYVDETDLDG